MDRNAKEKEFLSGWAKSNHKRDGFLNDSDADSYFVKREQDEKYIWEYNFESVPELKDLLEEQWEKDKDMERILKAVLAAAIKNKPKCKETGCEANPKQKASADVEELPMYIYNF